MENTLQQEPIISSASIPIIEPIDLNVNGCVYKDTMHFDLATKKLMFSLFDRDWYAIDLINRTATPYIKPGIVHFKGDHYVSKYGTYRIVVFYDDVKGGYEGIDYRTYISLYNHVTNKFIGFEGQLASVLKELGVDNVSVCFSDDEAYFTVSFTYQTHSYVYFFKSSDGTQICTLQMESRCTRVMSVTDQYICLSVVKNNNSKTESMIAKIDRHNKKFSYIANDKDDHYVTLLNKYIFSVTSTIPGKPILIYQLENQQRCIEIPAIEDTIVYEIILFNNQPKCLIIYRKNNEYLFYIFNCETQTFTYIAKMLQGNKIRPEFKCLWEEKASDGNYLSCLVEVFQCKNQFRLSCYKNNIGIIQIPLGQESTRDPESIETEHLS